MSLPDEATLSDTYGGPYTNERPVEDPTTEIDADAASELMSDTAGCTRMIARAWVKFNGLTYTSGTQSIPVSDHNATWGGSAGVIPVVTQSAAGIYLITWPATVTDEILVLRTLNIRYPHVPSTIDTALSSGKVSAFTANTMTVRTFNAAGAADALNAIPIFCSWT